MESNNVLKVTFMYSIEAQIDMQIVLERQPDSILLFVTCLLPLL